MHIGFFRLFSRHISRMQSFQENSPFLFQARVVLKPLVSLIGRPVACSARISVDTQTTVTVAVHACRPRVKYPIILVRMRASMRNSEPLVTICVSRLLESGAIYGR